VCAMLYVMDHERYKPGEPCLICGEPGCEADCLVGASPSPGDYRRAWLREHPDEQDAEPE